MITSTLSLVIHCLLLLLSASLPASRAKTLVKRQTNRVSRMPLYYGKRSADFSGAYQGVLEDKLGQMASQVPYRDTQGVSYVTVYPRAKANSDQKMGLGLQLQYLEHMIPEVSPVMKNSFAAHGAVHRAIANSGGFADFSADFPGEKRRYSAIMGMPQFYGKRGLSLLEGLNTNTGTVISQRDSEAERGRNLQSERHEKSDTESDDAITEQMLSILDRMPDFYGKRSSLNSVSGLDENQLDEANVVKRHNVIDGMPPYFGKRSESSPVIKLAETENEGKNSDTDFQNFANDEAMLLNTRSAHVVDRMPPFYGKRTHAPSNTGNDDLIFLERRTSGTVDRMPAFYGKRSHTASDVRDDDLIFLTSRALNIVNGIASYYDKHRPSTASSARNDDIILLNNRAPGVVDRMPPFYGKRAHTTFNTGNDDIIFLNNRAPGIVDRMPPYYGKRSHKSPSRNLKTTENDDVIVHERRYGVVDRMPPHFGKRFHKDSNLDTLTSDNRDSDVTTSEILDIMPNVGGKATYLDFVPSDQYFLSSAIHKRSVVDRMPPYYGKRSQTKADSFASWSKTLADSMSRLLRNVKTKGRDLSKTSRTINDIYNNKDSSDQAVIQDSIFQNIPLQNDDPVASKKESTAVNRMPNFYGKRGGSNLPGTEGTPHFSRKILGELWDANVPLYSPEPDLVDLSEDMDDFPSTQESANPEKTIQGLMNNLSLQNTDMISDLSDPSIGTLSQKLGAATQLDAYKARLYSRILDFLKTKRAPEQTVDQYTQTLEKNEKDKNVDIWSDRNNFLF